MPPCAVRIGILQVRVGIVEVADPRIAGAVQRKGRVAPHVPGRVHDLGVPARGGAPGTLEVPVGGIIITDVSNLFVEPEINHHGIGLFGYFFQVIQGPG